MVPVPALNELASLLWHVSNGFSVHVAAPQVRAYWQGLPEELRAAVLVAYSLEGTGDDVYAAWRLLRAYHERQVAGGEAGVEDGDA